MSICKEDSLRKRGICRCCLSLGYYKEITAAFQWTDNVEVYSNMLRDCFQIELHPLKVSKMASTICEMCITCLRSSYKFKTQVLNAEKTLSSVRKSVKFECGDDLREDNFHNRISQDDEDSDIYICFVDDGSEAVQDNRYGGKCEDYEKPKCNKGVKIRKEDTKVRRAFQTLPRRKTVAPANGKLNGVKSKMRVGKIKKTDLIQRKRLLLKRKLGANSVLSKAQGNNTCTTYPLGLDNLNQNTTIDRRFHSINIATLLKFSNCTPFGTKTLSGYSCAFCLKCFTDIGNLRSHTDEKHRQGSLKVDLKNLTVKIDITNLTCTLCNERMTDLNSLKSHLTHVHQKKFYSDEKDFLIEFKLENDENFTCALCNASFETFKTLLQHMNGHYRNYVCETCGMGFINNLKLKNHRKTHDSGSFPCQYCGKIFTTQPKLTYHLKFTHSHKRYSILCPHCGESFKSYYRRNYHMINVHNTAAASYKCNICDRMFLLKALLTSHTKNVHLMERTHVCNECGQGFYKKDCLKDHMIRHSGERVHKCDVCQKSYSRKKTLREHMRIHNNDRRFKCSLCGMGFVQKCSLKSHCLSSHGVNAKSEF